MIDDGPAIEDQDEIQDLIGLFMDYSDFIISPDLFRRWAAIAMVAGALERRVWAKVGPRRAYGNMFTFLVARPGVGKYIIEEIRKLWKETRIPSSTQPAFRIAPSDMTKASLVDDLASTQQTRLGTTYSTMLIAAEEMGVLIPSWDPAYNAVLTSIWNNPEEHEESRRGRKDNVLVPNPQMNILLGAQPRKIASAFPEEAWHTGLTSRTLMVYASDPPSKDIFAEHDGSPALRKKVLSRLGKIAMMAGELEFTPETMLALKTWIAEGQEPVPVHSKLEDYNTRRVFHVIKLALVSAVARGSTTDILPIDLTRALNWLFEIEALMPDIFRSMLGKSDGQILEELHWHLSQLYGINKNQPIHQSRLFDWLAKNAPSEKCGTLLSLAELSQMIERLPGDVFKPRPKFIHRGIE